MVLCEFFLNGNCRFGSRCNKDHIDLKTLIRSEMSTAITGKQWMLSCFGPFKGSVCVPNFIPDRSFEEVRLSYLEAKKIGNIQGHTNELVMQYNDAMSKMNQLKNCSPDTIPLLINIYNQSIQQEQNKTTKTTQQSATSSSNVFGGTTSNVFGQTQQKPSFMNASSIFGGSQAQPTQQNNVLSAGSIFGSSQQTVNPFQSAAPQSSIFGGPKPAETTNSTFPFSMGSSGFDQQQTPQQSIFGSSAAAPSTNSIFGGTSTFGQPAQQPSANIFAMNQQQQQPSPFAGGFGGNTSTTSSIFGGGGAQQQMQPQQQQQPFSSPFGGTSTFGQTPSAAPAPSIFGQTQQQQPPQNQTSIFSSVAQQQQQPPDLQSQTNQPSTGIFGQFVQSNQQQSPQPPVNLFAQAQNQSQTSFQTQQQSNNVFGQIQSQQQPPPPVGQQQAPSSIFQINQSNQSSSNFANPFVTQPQKFDDSIYSDPSVLSQADIAAFQADDFEFGKIPLNPPPRQFCI